MSISSIKNQSYPEQTKAQEVFEDLQIYQEDAERRIQKFKSPDNRASNSANFGALKDVFKMEKFGFADADFVNKKIARPFSDIHSPSPEAKYMQSKCDKASYEIYKNENALFQGAYDCYEEYANHMKLVGKMESKDHSRLTTYETLLEYSELANPIEENENKIVEKIKNKYEKYSKNIYPFTKQDNKHELYYQTEIDELNKNRVAKVFTDHGLDIIDLHESGAINLEQMSGSAISNLQYNILTRKHEGNELTNNIKKLRTAYAEGIIKNREQYLELVKNTYQENQEKKIQQEKLDKLQEVFERSPDEIEKKDSNSRRVEKRFPKIKEEFDKPEVKDIIRQIIKLSENEIGFSQSLELSRKPDPILKVQKLSEIEAKQTQISQLKSEQESLELETVKLKEELAQAKHEVQKVLDIESKPLLEDIKDVWQHTISTRKLDFGNLYKRLIQKRFGPLPELNTAVEAQRPIYNQIQNKEPQIEAKKSKLIELSQSTEKDKVYLLSEQIIELKEKITQSITEKEGGESVKLLDRQQIDIYVIDQLISKYKNEPEKEKYIDEISALNKCRQGLAEDRESIIIAENLIHAIEKLEQIESTDFFPSTHVNMDRDHIKSQQLEIIDNERNNTKEIYLKIEDKYYPKILQKIKKLQPDEDNIDYLPKDIAIKESTSCKCYTINLDGFKIRFSQVDNSDKTYDENGKAVRLAFKNLINISINNEDIKNFKTFSNISNIFKDVLEIETGLQEPTIEDEKKLIEKQYKWSNKLSPQEKISIEHATIEKKKTPWEYQYLTQKGKHKELIEKHGEYCIFHKKGPNLKTLKSIYNNQGLMCTQERFRKGGFYKGLSSECDLNTGGADNIFTRVITKEGLKKDNPILSYKFDGGSPGIFLVMEPSILDRLDYYSYDEDKFGTIQDDKFKTRLTADQLLSTVNQAGINSASGVSNEIMFNYGIELDTFKHFVACADHNKCVNLLSYLKNNDDKETLLQLLSEGDNQEVINFLKGIDLNYVQDTETKANEIVKIEDYINDLDNRMRTIKFFRDSNINQINGKDLKDYIKLAYRTSDMVAISNDKKPDSIFELIK